jgi:hypothetical protein
MTSSKSGVQNTRSGNSIQKKLVPRADRDDAGRKDQGQALLDRGYMPLLSDKDDLTVVDAVAMAVGEEKGTCKTPSK